MTALDHAFIKAYMHQGEVSEPARVDGAPAAPDFRVPDGAECALATEPAEHRRAVTRASEKAPAIASVGLPDTGALDALAAVRPTPDVPEIAKPGLPLSVEDFGVPPGVGCYEEAPLNIPTPVDEAPPEPFCPARQTDRFRWPEVCRKLTDRANSEVGPLADAIVEGRARDKNVVGIGSLKRGEGSTTLLLCAARRLAQQGRKVLLVDADLSNPRLPASLGLAPRPGWLDVLRGRVSLEEAVIESVADRVALLPLGAVDDHDETPADEEPAETADLDVLREVYDCVLIDLGAIGEASGQEEGLLPETAGALIDAVVLVQNIRTTSREELLRLQDRFTAAGIDPVGIAENFVSEAVDGGWWTADSEQWAVSSGQ